MMRVALVFGTMLLAACAYGQPAKSAGGFREVLAIVGIEPAALTAIDPQQPSETDWSVIAQVIARLEQHTRDLTAWTISGEKFTSQQVGELFDLRGTIKQVDLLKPTDTIGLEQLYRCRFRSTPGRDFLVLVAQVPRRWELGTPLNEPASLRGVLLRNEDVPVLLTTHLSWFPDSGLNSGKLLLGKFGMDAALWDDVVQRTVFVSPEKGREAQAFYAVLAAIAKVPFAKLAELTDEAIRSSVEQRPVARTKQEKQIAAAIAEQAALGLSSVAPLFLEPAESAGQLVRIEGTARRAVRIVADEQNVDQAIREYYEVEVFTADSQNLPIVCCVARLPQGFPVGDAIRAGVRLEGVFFKLWRYRSRKTAETAGETAVPEHSYTPVVLAGSVTWLQQALAPERWWGLAIGCIIFVIVMGGLLRMMLASPQRPQTLQDGPPDFSSLADR